MNWGLERSIGSRRRSGAAGLTASEAQAHATILAVVLWTAAALNLANPGPRLLSGQIKGTDFLHFYSLGRVIVTGAEPGALYDAAALHQVQVTAVPASAAEWYPPVYGPQAALLFAPFATVPYAAGLPAWAICTTALYALAIFLAWRGTRYLRAHRQLVWTAALAFPPFYQLLMHGQATAVILLAFVAAWLALTRNRRFLAGVALGLVALKPQLGIVTAAVVVLAGEWAIVAGGLVSMICQAGIVAASLGPDVFGSYATTLQQLRQVDAQLDIKPYQVHSVRGFLALLLPQALVGPLWMAAMVGIVGAALRVWKAAACPSLRIAALLIATVLASPHLFIYDAALLAPALLWWADWQAGKEPKGRTILLYWLFAAYLVPVALVTRVQISVLLLGGIGWSFLTAARDMPTARPQGPEPSCAGGVQ